MKSWILLVIGFGVVAAAAIAEKPLRWRAHFLEMKITGEVQDVSWGDLGHLMVRHGVVDPSKIFKTHDLYSAISAPDATPERVQAGRDLFNRQCSACHGVDARGGMAPNLTKGEFAHGGSDWGIYRTITYGITGTPMQPQKLGFENVWNLVTFLKDSVAKNSSLNSRIDPTEKSLPELNVSFNQINAANLSADWLTYSGTYDGQRHSTLAQITRENVRKLRLKWIFQFPKFMRGTECTPIVSGHTMFVTLPPSDLWALDTRTGEKLWSYSYPVDAPVKNTPVHNRGVAVLGNTVFIGTLNAHLLALNAGTGKLLWDVTVAENRDGYGITSAPLALKDAIVIGVSGGDFGIRGFVDAYSPDNGKRLWRFYTVPGLGEPAHDT